MNKCPYCKSERVNDVIIKLPTGQEQKVILCEECHKIFNINKENQK